MTVSNRILRFIVSLAIFLLLLFGLLVLFLPGLVRYFRLEDRIRETIEEHLGYRIDFAPVKISLIPRPTLYLKNFTVREPDDLSEVPLLSAGEIRVRPSLFGFLFRKIDLAQLVFKNTDIHYPWRQADGAVLKRISLRDASITLWGIRSNRPVRFKVHGKLFGEQENVDLAGTFKADFTNFQTRTLTYDGGLAIGPVALPSLAEWWGPLPVRIQNGSLACSGKFHKVLDSDEIELKGAVDVQNLMYEMATKTAQATAGDYELTFALRVNPETSTWTVSDSTLIAPFGGPFQLRMRMNTSELAIEELLVTSERLDLEAIPQYVPALEAILPLNLGFSGKTKFDVFVKGKPTELSFNTHVDLTNTTLTYSKYFSKPTGVPLLVRGELKWIGGGVLRGDFTVEFQGASVKGSVAALDIRTGTGEVTVLTNKFRVDGWNQYFPTVKSFELSGQSKLLASARGDFHELPHAQLMVNVSLDGLSAVAANGAKIQNLSGNIDLSPGASELKGVQFDLGGSRFFVDGKMLGKPKPRWLIAVQSPEIAAQDFFGQIAKGRKAIGIEREGVDFKTVTEVLNRFVQSDDVFKHLDAEIVLDGTRVLMPRFELDAYDGHVSLKSMVDFSEPSPKAVMDVNIQRLNLARMQAEKQILDGNLYLIASAHADGPFDSGWLDRLTGEGAFSITNGELHTIDLLGGLGQIAELAILWTFKSGKTRFNDIGGDLVLEGKRVETKNLVLLSDDFHAEGGGDIDLEGNLNYRLSVYLSPTLSRRIAPKIGENMRLGPIPILVVGTIETPSVRTDPMLIQTFLQNLVQGQFVSIASKFLPSFRSKLPMFPQQPQETTDQAERGEPSQAPTRSPDLKQALIDSSFNLLEQFLSKEKS